jgi:hypothetical protein
MCSSPELGMSLLIQCGFGGVEMSFPCRLRRYRLLLQYVNVAPSGLSQEFLVGFDCSRS